MMSSLGSDFFAGGALGVASSAIAVVVARVEGSKVHPSARVDSYVPSATCQLWRPKDFEQRSKRAAIGRSTSTRASSSFAKTWG